MAHSTQFTFVAGDMTFTRILPSRSLASAMGVQAIGVARRYDYWTSRHYTKSVQFLAYLGPCSTRIVSEMVKEWEEVLASADVEHGDVIAALKKRGITVTPEIFELWLEGMGDVSEADAEAVEAFDAAIVKLLTKPVYNKFQRLARLYDKVLFELGLLESGESGGVSLASEDEELEVESSEYCKPVVTQDMNRGTIGASDNESVSAIRRPRPGPQNIMLHNQFYIEITHFD